MATAALAVSTAAVNKRGRERIFNPFNGAAAEKDLPRGARLNYAPGLHGPSVRFLT